MPERAAQVQVLAVAAMQDGEGHDVDDEAKRRDAEHQLAKDR